MNDQPGPGAGGIIAGIFVCLFGVCLLLLGGGCTILFLSESSGLGAGGAVQAMPLFLISLAVLAAGVGLIWLGIKLMTGGFNKPR